MIKTKDKIERGKRKNGGAWLIASDGRNVGRVKISDLDRHGVPREGREVEVDLDNIAIGLPYGWSLPSGLTRKEERK